MTSTRTGSPRSTPSTSRSIRCSASRSARPAVAQSSSGAPAGALVSIDLASIGPLLGRGRRVARQLVGEAAPDLLFATAAEAEALLGRYGVEGLLEFAPRAVVKRGAKGATVMARDGSSACASRWPRNR